MGQIRPDPVQTRLNPTRLQFLTYTYRKSSFAAANICCKHLETSGSFSPSSPSSAHQLLSSSPVSFSPSSLLSLPSPLSLLSSLCLSSPIFSLIFFSFQSPRSYVYTHGGVCIYSGLGTRVHVSRTSTQTDTTYC